MVGCASMAQLSSRGQQTSMTRHTAEAALLCRPRSCSRSTAVRCFKGSHDDGATALRLNFKIPYRVNFGQSVGLVGSSDTLGNWDPKRTVQMKWSDGDFWTVELNVPAGTSALDLEYKYVVVNSDGSVGYWKPGSNYRVTVLVQSTKVPKRVKVADAWDDSFKKVDVEETDSVTGATSNGAAPSGKQQSKQTQSRPQSPTEARAAAPSAQPVAAPPRAAAPEAAAHSSPSPPAPATAPFTADVRPSPAAQPESGAKPATGDQNASQAAVSSNGAAPAPPPASAGSSALPEAQTRESPPPPSQAQQQGPPQAQQQAQRQEPSQAQQQPESSQRPQNGTLPRSASPRMPPASFAAVTAIPALHPSLMVEQERLEDGVRNSLEDLQSQMDKHQQLRERMEDPAATEVLVADRIVAAANNRVVAYNKALKAVQEYNRLPPSPGVVKETGSNGVE